MASNSLRHSCAAQPAKHTQFNICLSFGGRHSGSWQTHPFRAGSRFTTAGHRFLSGSLTGSGFVWGFFFHLPKNSVRLKNTIKRATKKIIKKQLKITTSLSLAVAPLVLQFGHCYAPPRALVSSSATHAPGLPERSAGLTASAAQCHGVH